MHPSGRLIPSLISPTQLYQPFDIPTTFCAGILNKLKGVSSHGILVSEILLYSCLHLESKTEKRYFRVAFPESAK